MRRLASTTVSLAGLALACSGTATAAVTVLGWPGGPEETALRAAADAWNARDEVAEEDRVELIFFSREGFFDKLQADLGAGTDAFDLNLLATYSIGRYAAFMEPVELAADAQDTFGESVLATMQYDGEQYGLPTDLSLHFLYYRTDLMEELLGDEAAAERYGEISEEYLGEALSPTPVDEWTWRDWAATSLYFTKSINRDSPVRYGTVLQMKNLLFNMMIFHSLPRSHGGDWLDESGEVVVDSEAYRTALELYKLLYDAGATPKDSLSYEYAEANAAYAAGQVASMVQWNAAAGELLDAEQSPAVAGVSATVAPPAGPEGRFTHVHGLGLGLNAQAKNPEGAKRFLQWLSSEEAILDYARAGGAPGLTSDVAAKLESERPDLLPLGEYASNYGFVMRGGTAEKALGVYELQANEFTGYWAGQQELDQALEATANGMRELLP